MQPVRPSSPNSSRNSSIESGQQAIKGYFAQPVASIKDAFVRGTLKDVQAYTPQDARQDYLSHQKRTSGFHPSDPAASATPAERQQYIQTGSWGQLHRRNAGELECKVSNLNSGYSSAASHISGAVNRDGQVSKSLPKPSADERKKAGVNILSNVASAAARGLTGDFVGAVQSAGNSFYSGYKGAKDTQIARRNQSYLQQNIDGGIEELRRAEKLGVYPSKKVIRPEDFKRIR